MRKAVRIFKTRSVLFEIFDRPFYFAPKDHVHSIFEIFGLNTPRRRGIAFQKRSGSVIKTVSNKKLSNFLLLLLSASLLLALTITSVSGSVVAPSADSDGDGMDDAWEQQYGLSSQSGIDADWDNDLDGWTNLVEFQNGTHPLNPDTDGDGIIDSVDPDPTASAIRPLGRIPGFNPVLLMVASGLAIYALVRFRNKKGFATLLGCLILASLVVGIVNPTPTTPGSESAPIAPATAPVDPVEVYGVFVGINNYPGTINDLSYCVQDATATRDMFMNQAGSYFPIDHAVTLLDSAATTTNILNSITSTAAQMDANDLFIFQYSGHGADILGYVDTPHTGTWETPHNYGNNDYRTWTFTGAPDTDAVYVHFYLLDVEYGYDWVDFFADGVYQGSLTGNQGYDFWIGFSCTSLKVVFDSDYSITDWGMRIDQWVEEAEIEGGSSILPYETVTEGLTSVNFLSSAGLDSALDSVPGTALVLIDSCNSGGFASGLASPNRMIATASTEAELAYESPAIGHGYFTYSLLHMFDGPADSDGNGMISFGEALGWAAGETTRLRPDQHPVLSVPANLGAFYPEPGQVAITFTQQYENVVVSLTPVPGLFGWAYDSITLTWDAIGITPVTVPVTEISSGSIGSVTLSIPNTTTTLSATAFQGATPISTETGGVYSILASPELTWLDNPGAGAFLAVSIIACPGVAIAGLLTTRRPVKRRTSLELDFQLPEDQESSVTVEGSVEREDEIVESYSAKIRTLLSEVPESTLLLPATTSAVEPDLSEGELIDEEMAWSKNMNTTNNLTESSEESA